MWAEDFAFYAEKIPSCFWFLGVKPNDIEIMPGLHNTQFSPDEEALIYGTAMMAWIAYKALNLI